MLDRRWLLALILLEVWALWAGHGLLALSATFGLLVAASVAISQHYGLRGVDYARELVRQRPHVGETVELTTTFGNQKLMPIALLEIEDTLPRHVSVAAGGVSVTRAELLPCLYMARAMLPYERVTRRVRIRCDRRGVHRFGPAYLRAGDYLGAASQFATYTEMHELLVLPKIFPLALGPLASQQLLGATAARRQLSPDPLRTVGARDYRPGDPLRSVDWRSTARRGSLMVRELEPSSAPCVELLLNVRIEAPHADPIEPDELEFAISVTASLAAHACRRGLPVGLRANTVSRAAGAARLERTQPARPRARGARACGQPPQRHAGTAAARSRRTAAGALTHRRQRAHRRRSLARAQPAPAPWPQRPRGADVGARARAAAVARHRSPSHPVRERLVRA